MDINQYIWSCCVHYIIINKVTKTAEYPIPRCDATIMYGFRDATVYIMSESVSDYHQIKLSPSTVHTSIISVPYGCTYVWLVILFRLHNALIVDF